MFFGAQNLNSQNLMLAIPQFHSTSSKMLSRVNFDIIKNILARGNLFRGNIFAQITGASKIL
jgi:hypothetical protein